MRAKKLVGIVSGSDDDDHEKSIKVDQIRLNKIK